MMSLFRGIFIKFKAYFVVAYSQFITVPQKQPNNDEYVIEGECNENTPVYKIVSYVNTLTIFILSEKGRQRVYQPKILFE